MEQESAMRHGERARTNARVLLGLTIVLIGVAILVEKNAHWRLHFDIRWWPFLLMFFGLARMIVPGEHKGRARSRRGGFWLLAVGVWAWISEAEFFGFDYSTSWPLLLIALGINIVWRSLEGPPGRRLQEH
jgi:hypothetical protein